MIRNILTMLAGTALLGLVAPVGASTTLLTFSGTITSGAWDGQTITGTASFDPAAAEFSGGDGSTFGYAQTLGGQNYASPWAPTWVHVTAQFAGITFQNNLDVVPAGDVGSYNFGSVQVLDGYTGYGSALDYYLPLDVGQGIEDNAGNLIDSRQLFWYATSPASGLTNGVSYAQTVDLSAPGTQQFGYLSFLDFATGTHYSFNFRLSSIVDPPGVPEPGSLALLGVGLLGVGFSLRRKLFS